MSPLTPQQKVFGIGLSKTGTSSLTDALNLLGISTVHYPHDEVTLRELRTGQYRLTLLDKFQGVTDIAVAPFYPQLDQTFPGSKFVLTVRDKEAWLRSCEVHWQLLMQWWNNFPGFKTFHEFASKCTYGAIQYSRECFSRAYDTHVANVRSYFRDRPENLLVMDICGGDGWGKLCPFLQLDDPGVPFPHSNEWMHLLLEAAEEVSQVIPEGETFVLVDEQGFGSDFARGRRALPFLERGGVYWGAPPNGAAAVDELERMRRDHGANYIAFGWPAFWWLEHYSELRQHLVSEYKCVLKNRRLVIFYLRN